MSRPEDEEVVQQPSGPWTSWRTKLVKWLFRKEQIITLRLGRTKPPQKKVILAFVTMDDETIYYMDLTTSEARRLITSVQQTIDTLETQ